MLLSEGQREKVQIAGFPVECCPTCYLSILDHKKYSETPNVAWMHEAGHPFSIGVDNTCRYISFGLTDI